MLFLILSVEEVAHSLARQGSIGGSILLRTILKVERDLIPKLYYNHE